ncbi:hypothetical protein FBZ98_1167 [Rhizobium sp. ERR 922]|uniref:hypothetical protein n=1 Tax=unclassified Rhizobium TaxID=2613769 RepID=UPI0011A9A052|nr:MULTISPECIES: hypothetical protein [unclassified Rhizobium]TWB45005.1 hypothetical protein FBZ98_1167 [Rhizobium sp. ERR 922]TWB87960.1 hypothetical protein FBZ97_11546 [Rhizobium sp. ERR 942]
MTDLPPPVMTQEIRIVDEQGQTRLVLSAKGSGPTIQILRKDGRAGASVTLDAADRPRLTLSNPDPALPTAALEIDDKGAHVKFDRPGGASSYLFLNNAGGSGVVLIDITGKRRVDATVAADGSSTIERFGNDGKPLP